ncbi:MAG TPA: AtzE family amidohydrolase, partial [Rubrivivax sp.]|nr:AtzE family amidohydrolase [Rubrivivax sp.]
MSQADQLLLGPAHAIAAAVRSGEVSAQDVAQAAFRRVQATDVRVNAFTEVTSRRALAEAAALDQRI